MISRENMRVIASSGACEWWSIDMCSKLNYCSLRTHSGRVLNIGGLSTGSNRCVDFNCYAAHNRLESENEA